MIDEETQAKIDRFVKMVEAGTVTEEQLNEIVKPYDPFEDAVDLTAGAFDPPPEPADPRAVMAEYMLDQYHLLKTNFKIREAMHKTIVSKFGPATQAARDSFQMMVQAEAELEQCKYEILELMGVDS